MKVQKVRLRKIKGLEGTQTGDLLYNKARRCEITVLRELDKERGFEVIFHDTEKRGIVKSLKNCRIIGERA